MNIIPKEGKKQSNALLQLAIPEQERGHSLNSNLMGWADTKWGACDSTFKLDCSNSKKPARSSLLKPIQVSIAAVGF